MSPGDRPPTKTVLIVEDNDLNLKIFSDLLEHHGYILITTAFGRAAVELAHQRKPDLIVLDIQLPDITGLDVAQQLKSDQETRAIPILAVTAFAMTGDRARVLASGCDDYLAKPFNVLEFLRMVEQYTSSRDKPGPS